MASSCPLNRDPPHDFTGQLLWSLSSLELPLLPPSDSKSYCCYLCHHSRWNEVILPAARANPGPLICGNDGPGPWLPLPGIRSASGVLKVGIICMCAGACLVTLSYQFYILCVHICWIFPSLFLPPPETGKRRRSAGSQQCSLALIGVTSEGLTPPSSLGPPEKKLWRMELDKGAWSQQFPTQRG